MRLSHLEEIARDLQTAAARLQQNIESAKAELDPFAAHYFAARKSYRHAIDTGGKSGNAIERALLSTYRAATDLGFKGSLRDWEDLLRLCLYPPAPSRPAPGSPTDWI